MTLNRFTISKSKINKFHESDRDFSIGFFYAKSSLKNSIGI